MKENKKGPGRPRNEIKTVAVNIRLTENAYSILDSIENGKKGAFVSKLIEESELLNNINKEI